MTELLLQCSGEYELRFNRSGILPDGYGDDRLISVPIEDALDIMRLGWINRRTRPCRRRLKNILRYLVIFSLRARVDLMKAVVVYRSVTEAQKKYAEWIAEKIGCRALDRDSAEYSEIEGADIYNIRRRSLCRQGKRDRISDIVTAAVQRQKNSVVHLRTG